MIDRLRMKVPMSARAAQESSCGCHGVNIEILRPLAKKPDIPPDIQAEDIHETEPEFTKCRIWMANQGKQNVG
jgi:hypothetical protein